MGLEAPKRMLARDIRPKLPLALPTSVSAAAHLRAAYHKCRAWCCWLRAGQRR